MSANNVDDDDDSRSSPRHAAPQPLSFDLPTSNEHNGRAIQIRLFTNKRPHMRAFHCAWIGFFAAFFVWFSITPLLSVIAQDLGLTRKQLWVSTMCSDIATILARLIVGPLCDVFGARLLLTYILALVSIPTALTGTISSFGGLCALRFFVGISGSSFVTAQYWMGQMFVKELIGTANAIVAGWATWEEVWHNSSWGLDSFHSFKSLRRKSERGEVSLSYQPPGH